MNTKSKKARAARPAIALLRHNQFARVAGLGDNKGIADATHDTLDALPKLLKEPEAVEEATLRRMYGPMVTHTRESMPTTITPGMVKKCLEAVAQLTTPHKHGWRAEHLLALCADHDCEAAIIDLVWALAAGDIRDATCDLLFSPTLVVLLKKTEVEMAALRAKQRDGYTQPQ
jgi:hypothetical protein